MTAPVAGQIKAWRRANRRMRWKIVGEAFDAIGPPPKLSNGDRRNGVFGLGIGHVDRVYPLFAVPVLRF